MEVKKYSVYTGHFTQVNWYRVFKDGEPFYSWESFKYVKHSPDGFAWGYNGSGPSQLAFALLFDVTGNPEIAWNNYIEFRSEVISQLPLPIWALTSIDVLEWIEKRGRK